MKIYNVFLRRDIESYSSYLEYQTSALDKDMAIAIAYYIFNIAAFGYIKNKILCNRTNYEKWHRYDDFLAVVVFESEIEVIGGGVKIFEKDFTHYQWEIQNKVIEKYGEEFYQ